MTGGATITMSRLRIVLGGPNLASYPEGGGHWSCFLQYMLGLKALNHDIFWIEPLSADTDNAINQRLITAFFDRMKHYGLGEQCAVLLVRKDDEGLTVESSQVFGRSKAELREIVRSADLLWNFASTIRQPLLSKFKRRVLIDGDPGHLQVSALSWDMGLRDHDLFFTVGLKMQDADCEVPRLNTIWHPFPQFVYLPLWPATPGPLDEAPFTSITQWTWSELWLDGRVLSTSKRDAYLRIVELPTRAGRPFELAINLDPEDTTGDRDLLIANGWKVTDPHQVAVSPAAYADYIRHSRAEISCPKPIYRELKTGWLSDRSAAYLASGRPVLAEETGFSDHLPTGEGLLAFRDVEEARAGVAEIDAHYEHHCRAARMFAEEYLDSDRCLNKMLALCGY